MACCSEYQDSCKQIVTIAYLNSFIGSYVQNSSGQAVQANLNALSVEKRRTDYCPTYAELTGGSLIPIWNQNNTTPRSDTDGILIGGSYESNQLVRQKDLAVRFTRFNTLSISSDRTSGLDACGDNATITTTYNYLRYTKNMNNSCTVESASTSHAGACGDLSWHTEYGSVANCIDYTIGKNGNASAAARCDHVSATTTFRGSSVASNRIEICQNALSGSYSYKVSDRKAMTGLTCTASPSSLVLRSCSGGKVSLVGTGYYDVYTTYAWVDDCGTVHTDMTQERKTIESASENAGSTSYTFSYSHDCCNGAYSETKSLSVSYGSYSCPKTFTALCEDCSSECSTACCKVVGDSIVYCSGSKTYEVKDCGYPDPDDPECKCAIVDGNHVSYVTPGGFNTDDSSHVTDGARFAVEVWNNVSDAYMDPAHATIDYLPPYAPSAVYRSSGRSGTAGPITITFNNCGDRAFWRNSQCVAAKLEYKAGVFNEIPACSGHSCGWGCYESPTYTTGSCDSECYDMPAGLDLTDSSLCYANYTIAANNTGSQRLIAVWWYPAGYDDNYRVCKSRLNIFTQRSL